MTQRQKQISMGAIAAVVIIAGVVYWFYRPANNANMPRGTWWICSNNSCKTEFSLSMSQLSDHHEKHYGQPVPCPKCGSAAVKADKCPSCGKVFVMQRDSTKCPACGKSTEVATP
jgi:rRNA maturation protein Nop10